MTSRAIPLRELATIKVVGKGQDRDEALRVAEAFRARAIGASMESFVFEVTGAATMPRGPNPM